MVTEIENNLYSKKTRLFIRIISLIAITILVSSNLRRIDVLGLENLNKYPLELLSFIVNLISIVLSIFVIVFPAKITILSTISFIYGSLILLFEPQNNLGIMMYGLSIIMLYARGTLNKHKKIKEIFFFIIYFALIFSELRFGIKTFMNCFLEKIAYSFVFVLCLIFLHFCSFDLFENATTNNTLDIQKFTKLRKRDAIWLVEILNGKKYEYLAVEYQMSLGSVKNRFKIIFDEIGCGDKQGFFNKYSDYKICYGEEFSFDKNKKIF
ncbi:MAG: hypothetical protein IJ688_01830 [Treponema sp.]|nr:hypothetical protein [Treponema sp.]